MHLIIVRVFRPKQSLAVGTFPVFPIVVLTYVGWAWELQKTEFLATGFFLLSIGAAYIQTWPAIQNDIPTFRILRLTHERRETTRTYRKIVDMLLADGLINDKVEGLVDDGLITCSAEGVEVKKSGLVLSKISSLYRRWLGEPQGLG